METVHQLTLDNGMRVHLIPKKAPAYTTYVELSVPFGALDLDYEKDGIRKTLPAGVAHFLEHKMFAMPNGDAFPVLTKLGADGNAMTSYETTSYVFQSTTDILPALEYLFEMIDTPHFTDENVDQERLIIKEELNMYLDDPNTVLSNTLMENMYHHHAIRYDILGTHESLNQITKDVLKDAYDAFYRPARRLLVIAGAIDIGALIPFLRSYGQTHPDKSASVSKIIVSEPHDVLIKETALDLGLSIEKLLIGFKFMARPLEVKARILEDLAMSFLVGMLFSPSSDFYQKMTDLGLINQSFSISNTYEEGIEHVVISGETSDPLRLKTMIYDKLEQSAATGLNPKTFERFKKVYLGRYVYALDNLETKTYLYGKYIQHGASLYDVIDIMESVTFCDVTNALKKFDMSDRAVVIGQ